MAIKIQTQQTGIPIEIGPLKFTFETSDENIQRLYDKAKELEAQENEVDATDLEALKADIKLGYDVILGEGAFEKVYEISPSVLACRSYLFQVVDGIVAEIQKRSSVKEEKYNQYLNKKRRRK